MDSKKKKILEYLYEKSINFSNNKKTSPTYNKDIHTGLNLGLSMIGLNYENDFNQLTVRVQFKGSGKYYTMGVDTVQYEYWSKLINEFIISKPAIDFTCSVDTIQEEELKMLPQQNLIDYVEDGLCEMCMQSDCVC